MRNVIFIFGAILCMAVAATVFTRARTPSQPVSAVAVFHCTRMVGLVLTDSNGTVQAVDLHAPDSRALLKQSRASPKSASPS